MTRTRDYVKKAEKAGKAASTLYHRYPKLVESLKNRPEAYNQCIKELRRAEKAGKVFVLAPEDMMGVGRTEASAEKLRKLYQQGYYQTKESMHALRLYLEEP